MINIRSLYQAKNPMPKITIERNCVQGFSLRLKPICMIIKFMETILKPTCNDANLYPLDLQEKPQPSSWIKEKTQIYVRMQIIRSGNKNVYLDAKRRVSLEWVQGGLL